MEQGALLVEKEVDGYLPLGAFGRPVHRSYVQLRAAVAQRLSSRCANLFARPQYDERSRKIRWISPIAGEPRNWRNLEPQEQAERALDLQIIRGEFEGYLAELRGVDGNGGGEAFGSVLEQSLKTPNDGHLHFVGDQPVMTFWGFTELNGDAFDALTAVPPPDPTARTADTAAPIITGAEQGRRWWLPAWLLWLLLLLLLLLIFLLWWFFWDETDPLRKSPPDPAPVAEEPLSPRDEFRILPDQVGPSGRPVIVQDTGFRDIIPTGEGLLTFRHVEEAAEAIREVESDYRRHAKAAHDIAHEYFDSDKVLSRLIEDASVNPETPKPGPATEPEDETSPSGRPTS
jgi:hypothetical protein